MSRSYHCERCGYDWVAKGRGEPKMCPDCKSRHYATPPGARRAMSYREAALLAGPLPVPAGSVRCNVCGYIWRPRTSRPVECARCHSRDWDKEQVPV